MPPFIPASKAFGALVSRKIRLRHLIIPPKNDGRLRKSGRIRQFSGIAGIQTPTVCKLIGTCQNNFDLSLANFYHINILQRRQFLGCGDGEEGDVLSKVYEERRVLG